MAEVAKRPKNYKLKMGDMMANGSLYYPRHKEHPKFGRTYGIKIDELDIKKDPYEYMKRFFKE